MSLSLQLANVQYVLDEQSLIIPSVQWVEFRELTHGNNRCEDESTRYACHIICICIRVNLVTYLNDVSLEDLQQCL